MDDRSPKSLVNDWLWVMWAGLPGFLMYGMALAKYAAPWVFDLFHGRVGPIAKARLGNCCPGELLTCWSAGRCGRDSFTCSGAGRVRHCRSREVKRSNQRKRRAWSRQADVFAYIISKTRRPDGSTLAPSIEDADPWAPSSWLSSTR